MMNSVWKIASMYSLDISPERNLSDKDKFYSDLKLEKVLDEGSKNRNVFITL